MANLPLDRAFISPAACLCLPQLVASETVRRSVSLSPSPFPSVRLQRYTARTPHSHHTHVILCVHSETAPLHVRPDGHYPPPSSTSPGFSWDCLFRDTHLPAAFPGDQRIACFCSCLPLLLHALSKARLHSDGGPGSCIFRHASPGMPTHQGAKEQRPTPLLNITRAAWPGPARTAATNAPWPDRSTIGKRTSGKHILGKTCWPGNNKKKDFSSRGLGRRTLSQLQYRPATTSACICRGATNRAARTPPNPRLPAQRRISNRLHVHPAQSTGTRSDANLDSAPSPTLRLLHQGARRL